MRRGRTEGNEERQKPGDLSSSWEHVGQAVSLARPRCVQMSPHVSSTGRLKTRSCSDDQPRRRGRKGRAQRAGAAPRLLTGGGFTQPSSAAPQESPHRSAQPGPVDAPHASAEMEPWGPIRTFFILPPVNQPVLPRTLDPPRWLTIPAMCTSAICLFPSLSTNVG